jgi:hypothetical protein
VLALSCHVVGESYWRLYCYYTGMWCISSSRDHHCRARDHGVGQRAGQIYHACSAGCNLQLVDPTSSKGFPMRSKRLSSGLLDRCHLRRSRRGNSFQAAPTCLRQVSSYKAACLGRRAPHFSLLVISYLPALAESNGIFIVLALRSRD